VIFAGRRKRSAAAISALLAAGLVVTACSSNTSASSAAKAISSITTAWPADITSLNPYGGSNSQDGEIAVNVYQGLVAHKFTKEANGSYVMDGSNIVPMLASSWTEGATSVTFHLRTDAKFYPSGDPVTADDVKWSLSAALASKLSGEDYRNDGLQSADDIHVVDAHTVTIDFKDASGKPLAVTPTIMAIYANSTSVIADSKIAMKHATSADPYASNWLRTNVVGTGPYYVASRQPGQQIVLKAVPGASPAPAIKTVTIRVVNSASIAGLLRGGTINLGEYNLSQDDLNSLQSAGFSVVSQPSTFFDYLALASNTGPLSNVDVRQAIADAVPYSEIVQSVYFGRAVRAYSNVQTSSEAYTKAWDMYSLDLDKAKQLMAQAGNPTPAVQLHYLNSDVAQEDMAILIQSSLAKIGVKVTLTPDTQDQIWDTVNARSQPTGGAAAGPPDMVLFDWSAWINDPSIPIGYETTSGGVNNYSLWSNPQVDAINKQYAPLPPSSARDAAYQQAQDIIAQAAPIIPIDFADRSVVVAKGITGANFEVSQVTRYWMLTSG
jgi:peptide/nickel transport system substrate-binding protein